ncbi:MAG: hypothetical protein J6S78_06075 [Lachnospiraceae bacterium]|nr:hypothetical protein [Lachnospiraceae bacterium]
MNEEYLQHFGILGMKWGIRRYQNEDGTLTEAGKKRYSEASKDAKEYARAKMFYGEGAGTRRKLIKAKVEEKSKDAGYKEAFDYALSKQDMSKHSDAAKRERKAKDVKNAAGKIGRGIVNILAGNPQRAAASVLATYTVLHVTGLDKKIVSAGKKAAQAAMREVQYQKWKRRI